MPNGHYDDEAGVCWDDEYDDWEINTSESYESQLPDHCRNPWGGYDEDCLTNEAIYAAAEEFWEYFFGESD